MIEFKEAFPSSLHPGSWASRTLDAVKRSSRHPGGKPYIFETSCVDSTYESINDMQESAVDVEYEELADNCYLGGFEEALGYGEDTGLALKKDWSVSFRKGVYEGEKCYFISHSCIEYIWVLSAAERLAE